MTPPSYEFGVTMHVVDLARMLRRRFDAALADAETGLTVGEARTLFYVWRFPAHRQAALADRMYIEPMTLVGYLDSLEKAELVTRRPDPKDKRAKLIDLTDAAEPVLERIFEALRYVRGEALKNVSQEDQTVLEGLLGVMKGSLLADDGKGKAR